MRKHHKPLVLKSHAWQQSQAGTGHDAEVRGPMAPTAHDSDRLRMPLVSMTPRLYHGESAANPVARWSSSVMRASA
jgi:hypothetical protein